MKFTSIRKKLIIRISIILILSFAGILSAVAWLNVQNTEISLKQTEKSIRNGLIAKGKTLISNNSQALKGMAEDNAFSAVQDLVSSTVRDDDDIVYGIFMDADKQPWVIADIDNQDGMVKSRKELDDAQSNWVATLEKQQYKLLNYKNQKIYEFAAPVVVDDDVLGFIRYGITTNSMKIALTEAKNNAKKSLMKMMVILIGLGLVATLVGFTATHQIATKITKPLGMLKDAAYTIAHGDYSKAVEITSNDEVKLLGDNFNKMRLTIQKKINDLGDLNAVGEVMALIQNQEEALKIAIETISKHTHVNQGSVYLLDDNEALTIRAFYPVKLVEDGRVPRKFKLGEGVLGKTAEAKKIIFTNDVAQEKNFVQGPDDKVDGKALLCVPLMDRGIILGVMNFSGPSTQVVFEESDFEYAETLARLLVITIKNIKMREMIEEQNRTLEHKVEERTAALQEKTNDVMNMMQNMHQGLFTIMEGNIIHQEYAAFLEQIFETDDIANRNFMDLVFSHSNLGTDALNQVETGVGMLLGADEMMFDFNKHCLAPEFTCYFDNDRKKYLEVDWDPIIADDMIDKVMVTVRDVTELKALQSEAEAQKKELEIIGQILKVEAAKFMEFIHSAYDFIDKNKALIEANTSKDKEVIELLFRNMHTIKGNARTYALNYITNYVHDAESTYDQLRKDPEKNWSQDELLAALDIVRKQIDIYADVNEHDLGRCGDTAAMVDPAKGAFIEKDMINALINSHKNVDTTNNELVAAMIENTLKSLELLGTESIAKVISGVTESMASLAKELDKPEPEIHINAENTYIKPVAFSLLNNIFMHLFRNSMDHGLESAATREQAGKSAIGHIYLNAQVDAQKLTLNFFDDGKGLGIKTLWHKAIEKDIYTDQQAMPPGAEIANLIFHSGFSTASAVTEVSGRGVGMDAVKKFLEQEGGAISIILGDEYHEGAEFASFKINIVLPESMFVFVG